MGRAKDEGPLDAICKRLPVGSRSEAECSRSTLYSACAHSLSETLCDRRNPFIAAPFDMIPFSPSPAACFLNRLGESRACSSKPEASGTHFSENSRRKEAISRVDSTQKLVCRRPWSIRDADKRHLEAS
jgi:hypothetical protein